MTNKSKNNVTAIICCAGVGKRLGIDAPKALLNINGKPLIINILDGLKNITDVRIVVGFKAKALIDVVLKYRRDITFVFNHNYNFSGPADSLKFALDGCLEKIMIIDGDIIINPKELEKLSHEDSFIGGTTYKHEKNVSLNVDDFKVKSFSTTSGDYSWSGISMVKKIDKDMPATYIYELLNDSLPLKFIKTNSMDINIPEDYSYAISFIKNNYNEQLILGCVGGMGTFATIDFFKKYATIFNANKEWERPRLIIDNNSTMPSRVRAYLYDENTNILLEELTNSIYSLIRCGANKVILDCNSSHLFLPTILDKNPQFKHIIVSIVETTCNYIKANGIKNITILGSESTLLSKLYQNTLESYGILVSIPNNYEMPIIRQSIEAVKTNNFSEKIKEDFLKLFTKGENFLLACTELPIIYEKYKHFLSVNVYDPIEITLTFIKKNYNNERGKD